MKRILTALVLTLSLFNSVRASTCTDYCTEGGGIENRLGTIVIQIAHIQRADDGEMRDQFGYPYAAEKDCWAVMVYNPFTTYFDDIIARWDF